MKLFEGLQCDKFDSPGAQGGVESFIHMDYSLDCKTRQHFTYSLYAYFMIVVYVVLLPGIMTWQKWKESLDAQVCPSILAVPYNKKWWYFDALEMVRAQSTFYFHRAHDKTNGLLSFPHSSFISPKLYPQYYRLSMTGFLILIAGNSPTIRIVCCMFFAVAFLAGIIVARPFVMTSHNDTMSFGQLVVCLVVMSGYVLTMQASENDSLQSMGIILLIMSLSLILLAALQHQKEPLFRILSSLRDQDVFDQEEFVYLWSARAPKQLLVSALLSACFECIEVMMRKDAAGEDVDRAWGYMRELFGLRGNDGSLIFLENAPKKMRASQGKWIQILSDLIEKELVRKHYLALTHHVIVHQGWCRKRGELNTNWKKRYLMLLHFPDDDHDELLWFNNESDGRSFHKNIDLKLALGYMDFSHVAAVQHTPESKIENIIKLDDRRGRLWRFEFSKPAVQTWVDVFNRVVRRKSARRRLSFPEFKKTASSLLGSIVPKDDLRSIFHTRASNVAVRDSEGGNEDGDHFDMENPLSELQREAWRNNSPQGGEVAMDFAARAPTSESVDDDPNSESDEEVFVLRSGDNSPALRVVEKGDIDGETVENGDESSMMMYPEDAMLDSGDINDLFGIILEEVKHGHINPTLFSIVQAVGGKAHRYLSTVQEREAEDFMNFDESAGLRLRELIHTEVKASMRQQAIIRNCETLKSICSFDGFHSSLDEDVLSALMCTVSRNARGRFEEALQQIKREAMMNGNDAAAHAADEGNSSFQEDSIQLKVGPIKGIERFAEKIKEYREEAGEASWPHSQFVSDVMRALLVVDSAEHMIMVYEALNESRQFEVVRLKNKIGNQDKPFNLHMNVLFHPDECKDPIVCEIQLFPACVYKLQHHSHVAYELVRAPSIESLRTSGEIRSTRHRH